MKTLTPSHNITANDRQLLKGLSNGMQEALDVIYERVFPLVKAYICRNSGTDQDAQDVFQDGLMAVYYNLLDNDFELTCSARTYIYAVCRNLWLKELRSRKIYHEELNEEQLYIDQEEVEDTCQRMERYTLYRKYFKQLGEKCQQILRYYMQGLDMKSIAKKMGTMSVNYTRKRKHLCKQSLIEQIKGDSQYQKLVNFE